MDAMVFSFSEYAANSTAWSFMRALDAAGIQAGFPQAVFAGEGSKREMVCVEVRVSIRTWMDREAADKAALNALVHPLSTFSVVSYEFGASS